MLCRELSIVCGNIDLKSIQNFTFFGFIFGFSQITLQFSQVVLDNEILF